MNQTPQDKGSNLTVDKTFRRLQKTSCVQGYDEAFLRK